MKVKKGRFIPRDDGTRILELVGMATTETRSVSVAKLVAPPGWSEAPQTPEYDEVVVVLEGTLTVICDGVRERIAAGEVGLYPKGRRLTYKNAGRSPCEYLSVCTPAYLPELAHLETTEPSPEPSAVLVEARHPKGKAQSAKVAKKARAFLSRLAITGRELSILLVGDEEIRALNRQWRRKNKPTDVLSFPAGDLPRGVPGPKPMGDVVISLDTAARVAKEEGRTVDAEVDRYLAHGILHLMGLDHERSAQEAQRMAQLESWLLDAPGLIPKKARKGRRT